MVRRTTFISLNEMKEDIVRIAERLVNPSVKVRVYDCNDGDDEQTYDVEVNVYNNGKYVDGFVNQRFYENGEEEAVKRGKAVVKVVKGWFEYTDIPVDDKVEVYG